MKRSLAPSPHVDKRGAGPEEASVPRGTTSGPDLASFFLLIERWGEESAPRRAFVDELGAPLVDALLGAGLLSPADARKPVAPPTDEDASCGLRCTARTRGRDPMRGEKEEADALVIVLPALEKRLAELLDVRRVTANGDDPLRKIGTLRRATGRIREVFISYAPWCRALAPTLALRDKADRPALVLVPTATHVPSDLAVRHGRGARAEIAYLEELVALEDGRLVLAIHEVERSPAGSRKTEKKALPKPKRWEDLAVYRVSERQVRLRVGESEARCGPGDLGMAASSGAPLQVWDTLLRVCSLYGWYHGVHGRGSDNVRVFRLGRAMQLAFGLADKPFRPYERKRGWRAKFQAFADVRGADFLSRFEKRAIEKPKR